MVQVGDSSISVPRNNMLIFCVGASLMKVVEVVEKGRTELSRRVMIHKKFNTTGIGLSARINIH